MHSQQPNSAHAAAAGTSHSHNVVPFVNYFANNEQENNSHLHDNDPLCFGGPFSHSNNATKSNKPIVHTVHKEDGSDDIISNAVGASPINFETYHDATMGASFDQCEQRNVVSDV